MITTGTVDCIGRGVSVRMLWFCFVPIKAPTMPHLVTHRPRMANLRDADAHSGSHKRWETFNAQCYKLGGLGFVAGSLFFFPVLSAYIAVGDWLFFAGSIAYLIVTGHDLLEVIKYWRHHHTDTFADHIEFVAAWSYVLGTLLFVAGSLCFLPSLEWITIGSGCFILGSLAFLIGGFVNTLQVVEAPSLIYMQLFNLTIACFLVGSALFTTASIPYLWQFASAADKHLVTAFGAAQFVIGSLLFLAGGILIYDRKLVRDELEPKCQQSRLGTLFIHSLREEIRAKSHLGGSDHRD